MFRSLGALLVTYVAATQGVLACLPTEFVCLSGACVEASRFCDGSDDCGDGSDEPHECTNCNRTYYGLLGVKYPLRLSEPVRRHHNYLCWLSFAAAGGRYGDVVEVTFLSFQIGTFQLESSQCYRGYMEIEDAETATSPSKRSVRTMTKKKGISPRKENLKPIWDQGTMIGSFCGAMIGQSATFYSAGEKVTLTVVLPSPVSVQSAVPRLYLTYRFLSRDSVPTSYKLHEERIPSAKCDVVFTDCHLRACAIRSPNFPGFYLRNLTCHFWVRQLTAPPGHVAQVELSQPNEFKISLLSGHTSNDRYKPGTLTSDCAGDVIRVFDGRTAHSPLLAEFCGAGPLPVIRSSGPDMLVQLYSTPFQPLTTSRFELDVRINFVASSEFRMVSDRCSLVLDGARQPRGIIRTPSHSIPANTTCSFHITSRNPFDRIWLYFIVYHVPDLHPWTDEEHCDVGRLEIVHPQARMRHAHPKTAGHHVVGTFCEKTSPRQCGHAADFLDFVPSRPCTVPTESYLSAGPDLLLELSVFRGTAVLGTIPQFLARYEVVNMDQPFTPSSCHLRFHSSEDAKGRFESPRNVFLYGRGGTKNLTCRYEFRGSATEKVRLVIEQLRFATDLCTTTLNPITQRYNCAVTSETFTRHAVLNATELWRDVTLPVGCVCSSPVSSHEPLVLESVGNNVDLLFVIRNMTSRDDVVTFYFSATYEFIMTEGCDPSGAMSGVEGHVTFSATEATPYGRVRCRWLLAALPGRALYIRVQGQAFDDSCPDKYLLFALGNSDPFAAFCASGDDPHYESVFSESWREKGADKPQHMQMNPDLTVLEVLADHPGHFHVHWVEVTKPAIRAPFPVTRETVGCGLQCPELEACISEELACDGVKHCPTGVDEAPERCTKFPLLVVVCSASGGVFILFGVLGIIIRRRLHHQSKSAVPQSNYKDSTRDRTAVQAK